MPFDLLSLQAKIAAIPDGGTVLMRKSDLQVIERQLRAGAVAIGATASAFGVRRVQTDLLGTSAE